MYKYIINSCKYLFSVTLSIQLLRRESHYPDEKYENANLGDSQVTRCSSKTAGMDRESGKERGRHFFTMITSTTSWNEAAVILSPLSVLFPKLLSSRPISLRSNVDQPRRRSWHRKPERVRAISEMRLRMFTRRLRIFSSRSLLWRKPRENGKGRLKAFQKKQLRRLRERMRAQEITSAEAALSGETEDAGREEDEGVAISRFFSHAFRIRLCRNCGKTKQPNSKSATHR